MTWAFSDESERGSSMLLGVAFVPTAAVATARKELRALLLPGQRRVHMAKESPRRRRIVLDVVRSTEIDALILQHRRQAGTRRVAARRRLISAAAVYVASRGASTWILDDQEPSQSARDRHDIAIALGRGTTIVYDHHPSRDEPLLWAIDAVVWATGAGPEWRRRVSHLLTTEIVP